MEERQNEILEVALDRLEQEGMWFTTKEDKLYANAKDLYKLDKYGELEDKSKERLVAEVEQYFGDGAAFVIDAVEQWLQDNLVEGILGYVDTLAMDFEIPEVIETIEAHDIQGVDDLDTTIAEEADLPEGVKREKKEEGNTIPRNWKKITYKAKAETNLNKIGDVVEVEKDEFGRPIATNTRTGEKGQTFLDHLRNPELVEIVGIEEKIGEKKSYEDYQEEIYYLEDIINDYEMKGRGDEKDYNRAVKRLNSIKAKFDNEDGYYTESKKVEAYYYNWKDDIDDVEACEANDDIWYEVAENLQQTDPDYADWDVYDIMSDIISIWKIEKRSRLYDYLLKWYGSEENLLANVRDVLDTNNAIYFITGCGYSIWSADLLGGKADGIAEREFDQFIANGCKKEENKIEEAKTLSMSALKDELDKKVFEYMTGEQGGFPEDEARDYYVISVERNDKDTVVAEVRAEISYEGLFELGDMLNPIVQKYDKESYFDQVTGGIMNAVIQLPENKITEGKKLEEDNDRDFEAFSKYIMDNVYCDSETLMTTPEIIEDNAGVIAGDAAKQVVTEILGETEYTGLYNSMLKDYEEEIKRIILNNIDRIVYLQNVEQEEVMKLIGEGKAKNLTEALNLVESNKVEEVRVHRTLQKGDVYQNEKGVKLQIIDVSDDKATVTFKFEDGEAYCVPMENANSMLHLNRYEKLDECDSVNFNKCTKDKLEEGVRQRLEERNEQSADIVEKALQSITDQTNEKESGIITKTSELFQQLSDRGYDVQVSFDNGESTSSIAIGQQGANILITITDPEQPLRAFASGNFELNDDSVKMIKNILDVL